MYLKMKASKVFVFPSLLEGWGLAVAEALACGLPVVCYDIPAIREIFGGCKSVFLIPAGNEDRLALAILQVLKMDLPELAKISKNYVKDFDWDRVAFRDLEIIKAVSNSNSKNRS
jgi:glycosyltransferase involved in cell wall biosynthesis